MKTQNNRLSRRTITLGLVLTVIASPAPAELVSLKSVIVPKPANLTKYVADETAAIRLGKALFWDMQVGSDGLTACATCHFHAGADSRNRNSTSPDSSGLFASGRGVNKSSLSADFPFVRFADPEDRTTGRSVASTDITGSQGVNLNRFKRVRNGNGVDDGRHSSSAVFSSQGRNVRQVTGRNAPSVINSVFNYANFHDGRANHFFNGVNPFGYQDINARILRNAHGSLVEHDLSLLENRLDNASLASQAVGPPLSDIEMSWQGRSFPELGRKMLLLQPLARQQVAASDSVLGGLRNPSGRGLSTTYADLIKAAFNPEYWNNDTQMVSFGAAGKVAGKISPDSSSQSIVNPGKMNFKKRSGLLTAQGGGYSQMEANFSFFFGMAVMLYEATLISDDTPFDRFVSGDATALTERQQRGLTLFQSPGTGCSVCHIGAEFTAVSISNTKNPLEPSVIEVMPMGDANLANYDIGFYNIGVTPTAADLGRGGNDPFGLPLSFTRQFLNKSGMPFASDFIAQPGCITNPLSNPPRICPPLADPPLVTRAAVNGAFKTPGLRNVELTGPYFHNGSMLTLRQVVDFYVRGGNFHNENQADLDPFVDGIPALVNNEADQAALIDFMLALTDERVRWERAPFDHPQLLVPNGHLQKIDGDPRRTRILTDNVIEIPAVGRNGRTQVQGPLKPFMDTSAGGNPNFHFN